MTFEFYSYRFTFVAGEAIRFPSRAPANILRGALGQALRRVACDPQCPGFQGKAARECPLRERCGYAQILEPSGLTDGPSGLSDRPRPFVIRAAPLEGCTMTPGRQFSFNINLFDLRNSAVDWLARAFRELARDGLGLGRGRADLIAVEQLGRDGRPASGPPISISLDSPTLTTERLRILFRTPTDLKSEGKSISSPDFGVLFARARDRVSTLRSLYGAGPLSLDFRPVGERARAVQLTRHQLQRIRVQRRSSRTGQSHNIGGFIGWAEYEGDLAQFLPFLEAAQWTGLGRHCVWGNGELRVEPFHCL